MSWLQVVVLAVVQGLTEFLPVSSSGHLILARAFFGWDPGRFGLAFDVACHVGTLLAVVAYFRADILRRLRLPNQVIARVDPLAVLPGGEVALQTRQIAKAIAAANAAAAAAADGPISVGSMPVR